MTSQIPNKPGDPWMVAQNPNLGVAAKVRRLRQLEFDARQALVATEEGMEGNNAPNLRDVLGALASLGVEHLPIDSPTKG